MELQSILTKMALEITERHAVVQGIPLVEGSDRYFWFGRPHLVLHLIHFALFQVLNYQLIADSECELTLSLCCRICEFVENQHCFEVDLHMKS